MNFARLILPRRGDMTAARARIGITAGTLLLALVVVAIVYGPLGLLFETGVEHWLNAFSKAIGGGAGLTGARLYAASFFGGLLASLSPCILGLLPVNLSYIGAAQVRSRSAAMRLATLFVLGVATTTVAVGLVSSLFFALFVTYRGQINIAVGVLVVVMALWMGGIVRLPVPSAVTRMPSGGTPYVVGLLYALVATPCASPVLVAVLGAAGSSGSASTSIFAMALYALGYTLVLWLASVFAGVAVTSRRLLAHGELITRLSALALLVLGAGFVYYGIHQL